MHRVGYTGARMRHTRLAHARTLARTSADGTLYAHWPAAISWFDMDLEKKLQAEEDAKKEAEAKRLQVSE